MQHLNGFSAVRLNSDVAASALEENLRQFGPVARSHLPDFGTALNYILPLKSFTTRYLVLGLGEWSVLLTDMLGANCYVEAYAISRARLCNAIGLFLREERRELHLFENGQKVRQIQSLRDGERWYYREEGPLQPFEDPEECQRQRKRDRLSREAVRRYFQTYTGLNVPAWTGSRFAQIFGLERSTRELRVQPSEFVTVQDL